MPDYSTADIRNIALIGHGGAGKTSLADAILHITGVTNRLGDVADGTSFLDWSEEARDKGCSLDSAACFVSHGGKHINVIDTPGSPDFSGPAIAALMGVEMGVLVVSASAGIEVNTRRMMQKAGEFGLARMIVINKIDAESVNLPELVAGLQELFGSECLPLTVPRNEGKEIVSCLATTEGDSDLGSLEDCRTGVIEAIVGADDELMEKYLGGEVADDEIMAAASKATAAGVFIPIVFTNARQELGVAELLDTVCRFCPNPLEGKTRRLVSGEEGIDLEAKPDGPFVAQVFKLSSDPKSNIKYSSIRIFSGSITSDGSIQIGDDRKGHRPGALHHTQGGEYPEIDKGIAGDVIAVAKLDLNIGDVLHAGTPGTIEMVKFPAPMYSLAIEPKSRADGDKVSAALHRFTEEDPCFQADRDPATHELVIHGIGDLHVRTMLQRISRHFKLEVDTKPPKIPYRETITGVVKDVEYTHKKQTGGAGQFGRVIIGVEPNERGGGYEFIDEIFGGAIDQGFRPSVDKGAQAVCKEGILAGFPVVDVKVRLTDGKTHPVDSKDIAFQIAGRGAFREAFMKAKPILLEPIVNVEVTVPAANVGDIQGDLASRRGRPQGQDMLPGNLAVIRAVVPLAELSDYNSRLSSITGGQGSYSMEFSHYEQVPGNVQQQIIDQNKKESQEAKQ